MLLGIYLGTTLASWVLAGVGLAAIEGRMIRENYRFKDSNKSLAEKIRDNISTGLIMLVPGLNIIIGGVLLFKNEEIYQDTVSKNLIKGTIERIPEEEKIEPVKKEEPSKENESTNMNKPRHVKGYSEMTADEKLDVLENERQAILEQKYNSDNKYENKPYNDRGPITKKK